MSAASGGRVGNGSANMMLHSILLKIYCLFRDTFPPALLHMTPPYVPPSAHLVDLRHAILPARYTLHSSTRLPPLFRRRVVFTAPLLLMSNCVRASAHLKTDRSASGAVSPQDLRALQIQKDPLTPSSWMVGVGAHHGTR